MLQSKVMYGSCKESCDKVGIEIDIMNGAFWEPEVDNSVGVILTKPFRFLKDGLSNSRYSREQNEAH